MISVMALLAVKALLAPTFVVGASLTVRRFGPEIGGLVGGLPVVADRSCSCTRSRRGRVSQRRRRRQRCWGWCR